MNSKYLTVQYVRRCARNVRKLPRQVSTSLSQCTQHSPLLTYSSNKHLGTGQLNRRLAVLSTVKQVSAQHQRECVD